VIYSKKECHLCEEAKTTLQAFARRYPLEICEIDIERDSEANQKYSTEIPVIFLEGRKLFKFRIDEQKFEKAIRSHLGV